MTTTEKGIEISWTIDKSEKQIVDATTRYIAYGKGVDGNDYVGVAVCCLGEVEIEDVEKIEL